MKQFALWLSAVAVSAAASGASRADYDLSLSAENADVNNLHVSTDFSTDTPPSPNDADGIYDSVFGPNPGSPPIALNGTFVSFEVTAISPGKGTLSFLIPGTQFPNVAATLANGNQNSQITPDTVNLDFTVVASGSGAAVPEPTTFMLLISSLFGLSAGAGLRGLVRRVHLVK
jgi:hypothetical protein